MFEDALFATNRRQTGQQRWAAMMSFAIQAGLVTVLVALPLFFTEALPLDLRNMVQIPLPPAGRPPEPPREQPRAQHTNSNLDQQGRIVAVRQIPKDVTRVDDKDVPPPRIGGDTGVIGVPTGSGDPRGNVLGSILSATNSYRPTLEPPKVTKPVPVSHIDEGLLVHRVNPTYPQLAMIARQQGTVVLHAIIGRDGTIQQLQAISGPPLLIKAAADAVGQWRYRPYILNGQPVEVDTTITVNFKLGG